MTGAANHRQGMWRYSDRLPVTDPGHIVSMGEGGTPLLTLSADLRARTPAQALLGKAEYRNPTGSYKDRIASVALSLAVERGLKGVLGSSSGNGGTAAAAYAAAVRHPALFFTRLEIVDAKELEIRAYGGRLFRVHDFAGGPQELMTILGKTADAYGWFPFLTAFRHSPDAMRGVHTIAYELAETAPQATVVYVPVGGGGLLTGIRRGYEEIRTGPPPRLVGVQPEGCSTLDQWLRGEGAALRTPVRTSVSGLQVAELVDADDAGRAVRESGGHAVVVSDEQIHAAQRLLAQDGVLVEPAGATAVAGVLADAEAGRLSTRDVVVVILSGAGYKDAAALRAAASDNAVLSVDGRRLGDLADAVPPDEWADTGRTALR
jgi:threonine synthase